MSDALWAARLGDALNHTSMMADILGGVVEVDMQVAPGAHLDVDQRMAAELFHHVIEEPDPGGDIIRPRPVEVHFDENVGFVGFPSDPASTHEVGL